MSELGNFKVVKFDLGVKVGNLVHCELRVGMYYA